MLLRKVLRLKCLLGLFALTFFVLSSKAQDASQNSISRIDSLTKKLYGFTQADCVANNSCFLPSAVNKEEFDAKMLSLGSEIDYQYNSYVQRQIQHMSHSNCHFLKRVSKKSKTFFNIYEPILDKYGIPSELKYLSVIESGLSTVAKSRVGASGLWQFMPGTGKFLNMKVGKVIDERYHISLATEKACVYLKSMYESFGNWTLALAAYNAGPGNVRKAISRSGGSKNFWKVQRYLPGETKNYVPRFMATVYLMENVIPTLIVDCAIDPNMLVKVKVNSKVHMKHIASYLKIPVDSILSYNPMYRTNVIDDIEYSSDLFLPYDLAMVFMKEEGRIYGLAESSLTNRVEVSWITKTIYHKVRSGQRIGEIAAKYGCTSYQIKRWNKLKSYKLYPGRRLRIRTKVAVNSYDNLTEGVYFYVVEKGESAMDIFKKYPDLNRDYVLSENEITSEQEELEEGRIIEVYYEAIQEDK